MRTIPIPIQRLEDETILAGRLSGKRAFLEVVSQLPEISAPTLILLDFKGIELATSSFLSEAVLPLREHLRQRRNPGYVALANLAESVSEEVEETLYRSNDAILCCDFNDDEILNVKLIGIIDQKLKETLVLVSKKGETTAAELYADSKYEEAIGATAWNNRLNSLAVKGLAVEVMQGRNKRYRPVLEVF